MMQSSGLSQRGLAEKTEVSEGTIRNALEYAQAADVRNDYAFDKLGVKQVRHCNRLPREIADLWIKTGVDIKVLFGVKAENQVEWIENHDVSSTYEFYEDLEKTGLLKYYQKENYVRPIPQGFTDVIKKLKKWNELECKWTRGGIMRENLRPYTEKHFLGAFRVRETGPMEEVLDLLIDTESTPPTFHLTPQEFETILDTSAKNYESHLDFMNRLLIAITEKSGRMPQNRSGTRIKLMEIEMAKDAPRYIQESPLPVGSRYVLWKTSGPDSIKQELAQMASIPCRNGLGVEENIKDLIGCEVRKAELQSKWDSMSEIELAQQIAERLPLYDKQRDRNDIEMLAKKLSALNKAELMVLNEHTETLEHMKHIAEMINSFSEQAKHLIRHGG